MPSPTHPVNPNQTSATQHMESLAEKAIPYDRTQPGYYMLQKASDILVDTLGFFGLVSRANTGQSSINIGKVEPINPRPLDQTQAAFNNLSEEVAFLERMNQPAYRSGIAQDGRAINATRGINRSLNHEYITFVENGQTKAISFADMNHAGTFPDRGGLTKAGRALQKKTDRLGSMFKKPTGTPYEINQQGQKVLEEILNHPDKVIFFEKPPTLKYETLDIVLPDGRGARFTKDGKEMIGFLEPKQ